MSKNRVLFVGSFKSKGKDNILGGQMFACNSLIESKLSDSISWELIDSTADSNLTAPLYKRAIKALKRLILFVYKVLFSNIQTILIFSADGPSFLEKGIMALIGKILGKRVVFAPRSGFILRDVEKSNFMKWFVSLVISKVDCVVCQSEYWADFFTSINPLTNNLIVIQNWIEIENFESKVPNVSTERVNILFMSWVDKNKGIFDLIYAAKEVTKHEKNILFHIAGNGAAFSESKFLVKELGLSDNFVFHGWVNGRAKKALLASANIYVLPSHFEGFPNSLIEAMVNGIAVVTSKVGSVGDIIVHGQNGLVFEKENVDELISCLKKLIRSVEFRFDMGMKGRQTAIKNNSVDSAVKKFEKLLF